MPDLEAFKRIQALEGTKGIHPDLLEEVRALVLRVDALEHEFRTSVHDVQQRIKDMGGGHLDMEC